MKSNDNQRLESAVERFVAGDDNAFTEIYDLTNKYLYYTISKSVNKQEVDDIFQNTYVDIYKNLRKIREIRAFKTWAGIIAQNNIAQFYKKNAKFELCGEDELMGVEEENVDWLPEDAMDNKETSMLIQSIIQELPPAQKEIIVAFYYNQMTIAQIASAMNIPEGSVKTNLYRGKAKIKAGVLELERKQGTKLHTVGIATVLFFLFGEEAAACELPQDGLCKVKEYQELINMEQIGKGIQDEIKGRLFVNKSIIDTMAVKVVMAVAGLGLAGAAIYGINKFIETDAGLSNQQNEISAVVVEGEMSEETVVETSPVESLEIVASDEKVKVEVHVDLDGIAYAYAKVMNESYMDFCDDFGLFDITGDGLPELFTGNGAEIITYWNNDRYELIYDMVILEWYYDEKLEKPVCYYSWDNGLEYEEWILYYNIEPSVDKEPLYWYSFGKAITENIDLSNYTYIDIHANRQLENSNYDTMKETLMKWFEGQEEYIYIYK